ncbi:MAG TPA: lipopolysaccharide biosynthesis protein [Nitrococcus sp.]|nr:lipopolysaccharide biosynthesis protein [Nitrococcus sp.]
MASDVRRALALSFAGKYSQYVLGLASNIILARLLTPAEIGVFSVAVVISTLGHVLRDFGVSQYLVQEKELSPQKVRAAFSVTLLVAWLVALVLMALSGPLAAFYGNLESAAVLRVVALTFFIIPFGSVTLALLRRDFRFGALYVMTLASSVVHLVVAVGLAWAGFGSMSLAWALVANVSATALLSIRYRPAGMQLRPTRHGLRDVIHFGGFLSGSYLIGTLSDSLPELIIGKTLGMSSVAFYSKAMVPKNLFSQFMMNAIGPVILPTFAQQARSGNYREPFLRSVTYLTGITYPFFMFIVLMADPVVHLLFGPQWDAAIEPTRILSLTAALWSTATMVPNLLIGMGKPRPQFTVAVWLLPLQLGAVLLASAYGLESVCGALLGCTLVKASLYFSQLRRHGGVDPAQVLHAGTRSLGVAMVTNLGPICLLLWPGLSSRYVWVTLPLAVGLAAAGWLVGLVLFRHPLIEELKRLYQHRGAWRLARVSKLGA